MGFLLCAFGMDGNRHSGKARSAGSAKVKGRTTGVSRFLLVANGGLLVFQRVASQLAFMNFALDVIGVAERLA
jgi:hypothetical protein